MKSKLGFWWPVLLPILFGGLLRFWGAENHVVGGDEMHAVRAALTMPVGKALTTYRPSDNCMPLTGYFRFLMDRGIHVSEMTMRFPSLLAGLLTLVLVPWWTARRLGLPSAVVVAWLLAISPLLLHYSRLIRSYQPIVFLSFLGAVAFDAWLRSGKRRWAAVYWSSAVLSAYFHLVSVPAVLSPFLFYAAYQGWARLRPGAGLPRLPGWMPAIALGVTTAAGFLLFLVPARQSLLQLISAKHQSSEAAWHTWRGHFGLQAGVGSGVVVTIFWLLAAVGLVLLLRNKPWVGVFSAVLVLGQVVGLFILSPYAMHQAPIFSRYLLVTLPWILIWVAYALAWPWRLRPRGAARRLAPLPAAAMLFVLFFGGPLLGDDITGPYWLRPDHLLFYSKIRDKEVATPPAYGALDAGQPGRIIEYPFHTTWRHVKTMVHAREDHGRDVIVASGERLLWDERLGFRNAVAPKPKEMLATDAVYLVVHLETLAGEARFDRVKHPKPGSGMAKDRGHRRRHLGKFDTQSKSRAALFERLWGPADYGDENHRVWDLERVRETAGSAAAAP